MYKSTIEFLKADFRKIGQEYDEFAEMTKVMDDRTNFIKTRCGEIKLWNVFHDFKRDNGVYPVFNSFPGTGTFNKDEKALRQSLSLMSTHYMGLQPLNHLKSAEMTDEELEEMMKDNELSSTLVSLDGDFFFTSEEFISRLGVHIGLAGDLLSKPSIERNNLVAYGLDLYKNTEITLTYRTEKGIKKLFDVRSAKYESIPQQNMLKVVDMLDTTGMGKVECHFWEINHNYSKIYLEFPEKAVDFAATYGINERLIPGLEITTSDLGQNAFTVRGTWNVNGSITVHQTVSHKHYGEVTLDDIIDKVERNIFMEYLQFPKKLIALAGVDITDCTLGESVNLNRVKEALKIASAECGLVKHLGKKREKAVLEQIVSEFDVCSPVTAFDIAIEFLEIPKRINLGVEERKLRDVVSSAVVDVIFADFSSVKNKFQNDDEEGQLILKLI